MFALLVDNLCRRFKERSDAKIDGRYLSALHAMWQSEVVRPSRPAKFCGSRNLRIVRSHQRTVLARKSA